MLYFILRGIFKFLFVFLGLKIEGKHNMPEKGPVIIASNHVSNWDPIMVALITRRPIYFMAKVELFKSVISAKLFAKLHAFPVKRGTADRKAIKRALDLLEQGKIVAIFPEGRRSKEMFAQVQTGAAMLALKSESPVVPVACLGTDRKLPIGWLRPLVVRVGEPINVKKYKEAKKTSEAAGKLMDDIISEIKTLLLK